MIKVYHFVRYSNYTGGTSKVVYNLVKVLNKYCNNTVVAFQNENENIDTLKVNNPVPRIVKNTYIRQILEIPIFNLKTLKLSNRLTKSKDTIVISHSFDVLYGDILHMHSIILDAFIKKLKNKDFIAIFYPLYYYLIFREYKYISKFKKIIAISNEEKKTLINYFRIPEDKVSVIPNGVDTKHFSPIDIQKKYLIRDKFKLPKNDFIIIFVGHYFKNKGLNQLIESLNILKKNKIKDITLLVVGGDNPYIYKRKADIFGLKNKIHFLGVRKDVNVLMSISDVFILPTFNEPFGLVGIEAMSSGLPVLITKTQGPMDYLKDGINGFFISRDPYDIAEKIYLLYSNRDLLLKMSYQARLDALNYSWENVGKKYYNLIDKVRLIKNGYHT